MSRVPDQKILLVATMLLLALGLIMVRVALPSAFTADILWVGVGMLACAVVSRLDLRIWRRAGGVLAALALIILLLGLVWRGVWAPVNGALAPFAVVVLLASLFSSERIVRHREAGAIGVVALAVALLVRQPDLSTALVVFVTGVTQLGIARTNRAVLVVATLGGVCAFLVYAMQDPAVARRFLAWLTQPADAGRAIPLPLLAIQSGGWTGLGLGQGYLMRHLPWDATDGLMAAMIGEQLGGVMLAAMAACYVLILVASIRISVQAATGFDTLLGAGLTCLIGIPALLHGLVAFGILPVRGPSLPLVSRNDPALLVALLGVGMLLALARSTEGARRSCCMPGRGRWMP